MFVIKLPSRPSLTTPSHHFRVARSQGPPKCISHADVAAPCGSFASSHFFQMFTLLSKSAFRPCQQKGPYIPLKDTSTAVHCSYPSDDICSSLIDLGKSKANKCLSEPKRAYPETFKFRSVPTPRLLKGKHSRTLQKCNTLDSLCGSQGQYWPCPFGPQFAKLCRHKSPTSPSTAIVAAPCDFTACRNLACALGSASLLGLSSALTFTSLCLMRYAFLTKTLLTMCIPVPSHRLKLHNVFLGILYLTVRVFHITMPRTRIRNRSQGRRERKRENVCPSVRHSVCPYVCLWLLMSRWRLCREGVGVSVCGPKRV